MNNNQPNAIHLRRGIFQNIVASKKCLKIKQKKRTIFDRVIASGSLVLC